ICSPGSGERKWQVWTTRTSSRSSKPRFARSPPRERHDARAEATGLGKRYRRTWGLRECSLSIPPGHVAALVGPNGAGKTTLLKLAVGLLPPSAGAIRTFG